jgi:PAS domain S-box-containing protein
MAESKPSGFALDSIAEPTALLKGLFEHSPIAFQIYRADGHSVLVNRAFRELFQSEPPPEYNVLEDELLRAQGFLELVHRAFAGETIRIPAHWHDPRELRQVQVRAGRRVGIEVTFFPLRNARGTVEHVALCFKDVTSELQLREVSDALRRSEGELAATLQSIGDAAQRALLKSEERFRRLVDAGLIGVTTGDIRGNISEANDAFLEMVGYSREEFISGKVGWAEITPPEWRHLDARAIEQLRATGVASPWEKEYLRKDGTRVPVLVGVAMLEQSTGEAVAFILDLTERKHGEAAIEQLRLEREASLRASIQIRDDFLAVAGHELRTPLTVLLLQLQALRRAVERDPATKTGDRLEKITKGALRLERLVSQLLDVSRLTAGRLELEPETFDLSEVVHEVVERFADLPAQPGGPITLRSARHVRGRWDRLRIEQVITNMVSNAVKYGLGKPIELTLQENDHTAVLRVIDQGMGIDETHQARIFERFERAVATRHVTGLGLGLWISRQIVEASGGSLEVESTLGKGSTFTMRLPISE